MLKIISNYRYWVLLVLTLIALFGLFAVPSDTLPGIYWVYCLISSKLLGFVIIYLAYRLYKRWERKGAIDELINFKNNY